VSASDGSGVKQVVIELVDLAGNQSSLTAGQVEVDVLPPAVVSASLVRTPAFAAALAADGRTLHASRVDPNSQAPVSVELIVYADEPLQDAALAVSGPQRSTSGVPTVAGALMRATHTLTDLDLDGSYDFAITWTDRFGNSTTLDAGMTLVIDLAPPALDIAKGR